MTLGHWKINNTGCGGSRVYSFVVDGVAVGSAWKSGDKWVTWDPRQSRGVMRVAATFRTLAAARNAIIEHHTAATSARSRKASRKRAPTAARRAREVKK